MSSTNIYTFEMQKNMEILFGLAEDRSVELSDQSLSEISKEKYILPKSERKRLSEMTKAQFADPIMRKTHLDACYASDAMHKNKKWMNKDGKNRRIHFHLVNEYISKGYHLGRYIPSENAFWDYDKTGINNPFYGKKHTGDMNRFNPRKNKL